MYRLATKMHRVADNYTNRQRDRPQYHANSRSHCVQLQ